MTNAATKATETITISNIRPSTTGVAKAADMTATLPSGETVDITIAYDTTAERWAEYGNALDMWVSDPDSVPADLVGELRQAGIAAAEAMPVELHDAVMAVRDANDDSDEA